MTFVSMYTTKNCLKSGRPITNRKIRYPLTPFLYCLGPRVAEPKKWLFPNFVFKGWEWCIWTITTIIHHQIWSADSTVNITVIQSSKLPTLRSTFERVPVNHRGFGRPLVYTSQISDLTFNLPDSSCLTDIQNLFIYFQKVNFRFMT